MEQIKRELKFNRPFMKTMEKDPTGEVYKTPEDESPSEVENWKSWDVP